MREFTSRNDVFEKIYKASRLDMLGLFVGAGFSKAVIADKANKLFKAYGWEELLDKCCEVFGIDNSFYHINDERINKEIRKDYPGIATIICRKYAEKKSIKYSEAVFMFKEKICELTTIYPNKEQREMYNMFLKQLNVNWITTTNYDHVLESIYGSECFSIQPGEYYTKIKGIIPIYHIHGVCNNPEGIVITNEDYINMFRPSDYRQARLPFLFKESLVVMLGYALGDFNVNIAVDWPRDVYTNNNRFINNECNVIQLLYKDNPKDKPYKDNNGVVILEISGIEDFFREYEKYAIAYNDEYNKKKSEVDSICKLIDEIHNCDNETRDSFLNDYLHNINGKQDDIIKQLSKIDIEFSYVFNSFFRLIRLVLENANKECSRTGNFSAYDYKLKVIINILKILPGKVFPNSFMGMLAYALDEVGIYIGDKRGDSWAAKKTWEDEKSQIPDDVIHELKRFAKSSNKEYMGLERILDDRLD